MNDLHKHMKTTKQSHQGRKRRDYDHVASNGKTYHLSAYRLEGSELWMCQITGESNGFYRCIGQQQSASKAKNNAIKCLEAALKERG